LTSVFLHALPFDPSMWDGYEGVKPRLYGRGPSLERWAEQLLDEIDGDRLVLIGASMGGYTALAMAKRSPDRVAGLALVGSRAGADPPERRPDRDETIRKLREEGTDAVWPGIPEPAEELADAVTALRDRPDLSDVPRLLDVPFLVCVGTEDQLTNVDEARAIAASAPGGRVEVFEGAGHILSLDQPERFRRVLDAFLAESA
jgi:pimeloyl-ACP methyl ester carboxylesterase